MSSLTWLDLLRLFLKQRGTRNAYEKDALQHMNAICDIVDEKESRVFFAAMLGLLASQSSGDRKSKPSSKKKDLSSEDEDEEDEPKPSKSKSKSKPKMALASDSESDD